MDILKQRFTYAKIRVGKDYSTISKPRAGNDDIEIFVERTSKMKSQSPFNSAGSSLDLYPYKGGRNTNFYYINDTNGKRLSIETFKGEKDDCFFTNKDKHIKRHYGRPFSEIIVITAERSIKIVDNKLIAKSYKNVKHRGINKKYFKNSFTSDSLIIDLNNGNFTISNIIFRGKNKGKKFRKNSFSSLESLMSTHGFISQSATMTKKNPLFWIHAAEMDDMAFFNAILENINQPNLSTPITENSGRHEFLKHFIKFFVNRKQIKVPDNYRNLIRFHYPGEKYLKKNDRKLIMSVLDSYGIKSKLTNKILHENPDLDIDEFKNFISIFNRDYPKYISALDDKAIKIFVKLKDNNIYVTPKPINIRRQIANHFIENSEKENIIKIVNSLVKSSSHENVLRSVSGLYGLFRDHIDMITKLREYDPTYRLTSTNYDEFHNEHLELSKLVALIKKGWSTEYVYDNRTVRKIESPIKYIHEGVEYEFKPTILKRDEEYSEEGSFMHHCVASYANKHTSMIISLRLDSTKDRVTCEYDKKTGDTLQERHFCNRIPPEHFNEALKSLSARVKSLRFSRLLDHIDVKRVKVQINGKDVKQEDLQNDPFMGLMGGF